MIRTVKNKNAGFASLLSMLFYFSIAEALHSAKNTIIAE
ncbi:hypothetical protein SAMN05421786_10339 [Chryseobacterium ureilyticum]|uniref:Uncharacterized protein n=1 Tax=Chryseobacterium ureilyticum TaxID=373668 RepID=A0A1N7MYQ2_9FLAO|nr:hypothetical protein SAMN05421786_10339 [Chryseobacterium ureilyticum]